MKNFFLITKDIDIFDQLKIEEAFLRAGDDHLIWINIGSKKNIVLGISSKESELVNIESAKALKIPLIRRYSGGGTVVVDENTIFITFIFNHEKLSLQPFPTKIMEWSAQFYKTFLENLGFKLKENDYVLKEKKFGGNAQYLTKNRFVHHSTLLYDYDKSLMNLLKNPSKAPNYRSKRSHDDFLVTLKNYFSTKEQFIELFKKQLEAKLTLTSIDFNTLALYLDLPHRKSTEYVISRYDQDC